VVAVGFDASYLGTLFDGCTQVGAVTNRYGLRNDEYGQPLVVCTRARLPLDVLWPRLKAFR
jgi:hypothetical protein